MAGPDPKQGATFTVTPEVSEALFKQFAEILETRLKQTAAEIVKAVEVQFAKIGVSATKAMTKATTEAVKAGRAVSDLGGAANAANKGMEAQVASLIQVLDRFGRSVKENVSVLTSVREANRRTSVELTARSQDVARQQIEDTRRASTHFVVEQQRITSAAKSASEERIQQSKNENRLAVVAAQAAASRRIVILQAALQTIGRLEKGLGASIAGTARTATAAFSKIFDSFSARRGGGIAGAVTAQNGELNSALKRTNSIVETNTKQINNSFVEGTSRTLNQREDIIRRSFIQQEQIVRRSALRQEATMASLRKATSTGVAGAVTGRGVGLGIGSLVGGVGLAALFKQGFNESVNLNEQLNKTRVVFGQAAQSVVDFAQDSVNSLGATKAEALTAAATFGNLFRAIGISEKPAAKMSTTLVQLAADLSSFNNVPIEDAFAAIQSGLVGEQEPLRKFGVNLNDITLKAKAMELGLFNGKGVLDVNAKAQAAYALILEQTSLAQGDFARTADQGANAQRRAGKALTQFFASIAGKLLPTVTIGFNLFTKAMSAATKVMNDSTNPALKVLKDALSGAALGLLAIIAAKGAIEVIRLLGTVSKFTLTPLGGIVLAATLIGAVLSVLLRRSAPLRDAFAALAEQFSQLGSNLLSVVAPALQAVVRFIDTVIIPGIERLVIFLAEHVVKGFEATRAFIVDVAVPAIVKASQFVARNAVAGWQVLVRFFESRVLPVFRTIVAFVEKSVIPRLVELARVVKDEVVGAFKFLVDFVTSSVYPALFSIGLALGPTALAIATVTAAIIFFWDQVGPVLQPAIDGFKTLGDVIRTAFSTGDFGAVGAGFAAAGGGILTVLKTVGGLIVSVLSVAFATVVATMKRVFSLPNLIAAGQGFLDFVEFIGNTLGKIVTDPRFITAVAALGAGLVAAAGLVAFRFLKGFVGAFLENLGANFSLIAGALLTAVTAAFKFVFTNPGLAALILTAILAIFKAKALITGITQAGQQAGKGFFTGFGSTVKKGAGSNLLQFKAMFDGEAFTKYAKKQGQIAGKALQKEFFANNNLLKAAGQTPVAATNRGFLGTFVSQAQLDETRAKVAVVKASLGEVGSAALDARAKSLALITSIKGIGTAIGGIKGNFDSNRGAGAGFFKSLTTGFRFAINDMKAAALSSGLTIGGVLGGALKAGAVAAISAAGGFIAGKAEGSSGGSGLMSALIGGSTAFALAGGGPQGAALGAITAGASLLGAALGRASKRAKEFREEVDKLSKSFTDGLNKAIEDGTIKLDAFGDTKINISDIISVNQPTVVDALKEALSTDQLKLLNQTFGDGSLAKIANLLVASGGDLDKFTKDFDKQLSQQVTSTKEFVAAMGGNTGLASQVGDVINQILQPGDNIKNVQDFLGSRTHVNASGQAVLDTDPVTQAVAANKELVQSTLDIASEVAKTNDIILKAADAAGAVAKATAPIPQLLDDIEHRGLLNSEAQTRTTNALRFADGLISKTKELQSNSQKVFEAFVKIGIPVEEAQRRLDGMHLPRVPQSEVDAFTGHLQEIENDAKHIVEELDKIPQAFADAIAAANGIQPTVTIDEAILGSADVAGDIANAIAKDGVIGGAELNEAIRKQGLVVGQALADGVATGAVVDVESAKTFLAPVQEAMLQALGPKPDDPALVDNWNKSVAAVKKIFTDGLNGIQVVIDQEALDLQIQEFMKTHSVTIDVFGFWNGLTNDVTAEGDLRRFGTPQGARVGDAAPNAGQAQNQPLIGTLNINGATSPTQTANKVTAAVRAQQIAQKGMPFG